MAGDDMNFFSATPSAAQVSAEPPPPASEDDYGENVVPLAGPRKRVRADWQIKWHMSPTGTPLPNLFNVMLCLRHHPQLHEVIKLDEMACRIVVAAQIPGTAEETALPRPLTDADVLAIQEAVQLTGLRRVAKATVQDAIELRAAEQRFHPVRDYLDSLVWDGEKRMHKWLAYYFGVEHSDYASTVGRLFLVALVARVMRPGCKVDYMMILEGPQGEGKSQACRILAGDDHFSDNLPDLARADAVRLSMHLRGKWLIEIGELAAFNRAEAHRLKEFLTQTEERYTPKYARNEVREPRQCLFIGTTNEGRYLRDATGARRFWPVQISRVDLNALREDRDQLIAEAVAAFKDGAQWWPDREFEQAHIAPEQDARYEADAWEDSIETWLQERYVGRVSVNEVLRGAVGLDVSKMGTTEQRRVSAILQRLGWIPKRSNGKRFYERPQSANPLKDKEP